MVRLCFSIQSSRQLTEVSSEQCHLVYYPYDPQRLYGPRSELHVVKNLQSKHDKREYGRRQPPIDLSIIATLSDPTVSQFSKTSKHYSFKSDSTSRTDKGRAVPNPVSDYPLPTGTPMSATYPRLTMKNLLQWESDYENGICDYTKRAEGIGAGQVALPAMDWKSGPSAMMAWLNSSALPSTGGVYPPSIEETQVRDDDEVDEEEDLEILRRVCMARSMPAARHYLDAPEYSGMEGPAIIYLRKILDMFPKLPPFMARRLAQRNRDWMQKMSKAKVSLSSG